MKILHVVGARPNFMKAAPVMAALAGRNCFKQVLAHTGQHYDSNMSAIFFIQLGLPKPDFNLGVGSGSHATQTSQIMQKIEGVLNTEEPDVVLVYGDVNSTAATALVCSKLLIPVGHVEAGLRSFDRTMPEEINRVITDQVADLLFTPSADADENLLREGIASEKIHLVGNVMIDTLVRLERSLPDRAPIIARTASFPTALLSERYGLVTLHRPANVDHSGILREIMTALEEVSKDLPLIFPIHPRTRQRLHDLNIRARNSSLWLIEPVGYLEFLSLQKKATVVITDSGGIQEETTFLGVPCLTVRENTERPITIHHGTNRLVGRDMSLLKQEIHNILNGMVKRRSIPPLWDGRAGERIADAISAMK